MEEIVLRLSSKCPWNDNHPISWNTCWVQKLRVSHYQHWSPQAFLELSRQEIRTDNMHSGLVKRFDHMSLGQGVQANLHPWPLQKTQTPPGNHFLLRRRQVLSKCLGLKLIPLGSQLKGIIPLAFIILKQGKKTFLEVFQKMDFLGNYQV